MSNLVIDTKVLQILAEETGISLSKIGLDTTLLGDLGIDGDAAWSLFETCHQEFGLDLTYFEFHRYFRHEPCLKGLVYLYRKLRFGDEHIAANKEKIFVSTLIQACKTGCWGVSCITK